MANAENIKLGTCKITYGGVDLGLTAGGVEVEVATTTHETKVDQLGESVVNEFITGRTVMAKCPLVETTIDNLVNIMPGATKVIDGSDSTLIRVDVGTSVGVSLLENAQELILHPISLADADVSEDFIIPLAGVAGALSFAYKLDQERTYVAEFKGYPDTANGGLLFQIGDKTATA
jgi:hypothetical protein